MIRRLSPDQFRPSLGCKRKPVQESGLVFGTKEQVWLKAGIGPEDERFSRFNTPPIK